MRPFMLAVSATSAICAGAGAQSFATYELAFESNWTPAAFPGYPGGAHWSALVGGTHSQNAVFWEPGGLASPGIKNMAETGGVFPLFIEIQIQVSAGNAWGPFTGPGNLPTSTATMVIEVPAHLPLATFVTMVAPSPDWFVGTNGIPLRDGNGWIPVVTHDLFPYDAGTDSGATYTSPNLATTPPEPIFELTNNHPLFPGTPPMGKFTFTLVSISCLADCDGSQALDFFDFLCFQNEFATATPYGDCDGNFEYDFFDFLCFQNLYQGGC